MARRVFEQLERRALLAAFTVNSMADTVDANPGDGLALDVSGNTSLRAAVMESNALAGDDTIQLGAGTFPLTLVGDGEDAAATGDLDVTDTTGSLTITGAGAGSTIIDANALDDRVFHLSPLVTAAFVGVTITGGHTTHGGGGIFAQHCSCLSRGTLTISSTNVTGNVAGSGGGVFASTSNVTVTNSLLSENSASNSGGISFSSGTLTISGSVVSGNSVTFSAGGINLSGGSGTTTTIMDSIVSENSAGSFGGGIQNISALTVSISNSSVSGNTARLAGGILNHGSIAISNSSVSDNVSAGEAGAIDNSGTLSITNSELSRNTAASEDFGRGGAIRNGGTLTIGTSTLSDNSAGTSGGGVYNSSRGVLTITDSAFERNSVTDPFGFGGGILSGGSLTISGTTFANNVAGSAGGVFHVDGSAIVSDSTFTGNTATRTGGGAIQNRGEMEITASSLFANDGRQGGAVYNQAALSIDRSVLSGNTSGSGGGIANASTLSGTTLIVTNSTLSANVAEGAGGGIHNRGTVTLTATTVAENSAGLEAGGVYNSRDAVFDFRSTVLAGNGAPGGPNQSNASGAVITSQGFNLVGDNTDFVFTPMAGDLVGTAANPIDALLGPLQDNGGPTLTHALLSGSPAIDTAACTDANGDPVLTDQRGIPRPHGAACDIGAFEVSNKPPTAGAGGPSDVDEGGSVQLDGSGSTDPDLPDDTLTYVWDLDGDGNFGEIGAAAERGDETGVNPVFSAAGLDGPSSEIVHLRVTDEAGLSHEDSATINIENVKPTITSLIVPLAPVNIADQSSYSIDVAFNDPGGELDEDYVCEFDLDGDSTMDATVSGVTGSSCSTTLSYTEPGVYEVTVTVTDKDGGVSDPVTASSFVVIYDPAGGFVTGGGWIDSPAGALVSYPGATGNANFGFVSKYKKGASVPTGSTEFNFSAGDLNLHSDTYDWLVINQNDTSAQYKGSGTINGATAPTGELYKFMIWAQDLDPGGDDTFRIKVWYEDGGEVLVYDNGFNQVIGGGNIQIHGGGNSASSTSQMIGAWALPLSPKSDPDVLGLTREDDPSAVSSQSPSLAAIDDEARLRAEAAIDFAFLEKSQSGVIMDSLLEELAWLLSSNEL